MGLLPAAFCCTEFGVKCSAPSCVRLLKFNSAERGCRHPPNDMQQAEAAVAAVASCHCQLPVASASRQLVTTVDNCPATAAATTTTRTTFWRSDKMSKTDERFAWIDSATTTAYPVCRVATRKTSKNLAIKRNMCYETRINKSRIKFKKNIYENNLKVT